MDQSSARLKKVFYFLRPLLAGRWIEHTLSQPPTEFERLLQAEWATDDERQMISQLQAAKALASEADRWPMPEELSAWLTEQMAYF
nr:nucleotidyltransferase domain-containing protein [Pseudomarimonas arenosa]